MWRNKKLIVIALLAAVLAVGSIGGIVLAQTENGDEGQPGSRYEALLDKVCGIYEANTGTGIDSEQLILAFDQARKEMGDEALDNRLQNLIDQGEITQEEADQYKAWLQARPDTGPYRQQLKDWQQGRPDIPSEMKDWQQARPDVPLGGRSGRAGGHGFTGRIGRCP